MKKYTVIALILSFTSLSALASPIISHDVKISLKAQLKRHEGVRYTPYYDSLGIISVGVGRNLKNLGLRPKEVEFMLDNDINASFEDLVKKYPWFVKLAPARQVALANMRFQLGGRGFDGFKNTLNLIKRGEYKEAAHHILLSKYAHQVPKRATEIADMIDDGKINMSITFKKSR